MTCAVFSKLLSRLLQNFVTARETPSNFEIHYAETKKWWTESGYQLFAFVPESRVSCKMCTTPEICRIPAGKQMPCAKFIL
jgi:hypothetical protein